VLSPSSLNICLTLSYSHLSQVGPKFEGIGGLSAGASSRLLFDYSFEWQNQILDILFAPGVGAALQTLKVEIGGDTQTGEGTEPSHSHFQGDLNCTRGWEFWLMQEARTRNPNITLYALSWGSPNWVGGGDFLSQEGVDYHLSWLTCARDFYNLTIDYLGVWNERDWGSIQYIEYLKQHLNGGGFSSIQLVIPDSVGDFPEDLLTSLDNNTLVFPEEVSVIGTHYPCSSAPPSQIFQQSPQLRYWASEDYSTASDWNGASCWGRLINQNHVRLNATSTIAWALIWSVYPSLPNPPTGLMRAQEPWSGYFSVDPPIWVTAHTTQFTQVGWNHLPAPASGLLPQGGSYVSYLSPEKTQFTMVIETLEGACSYCALAPPSPPSLQLLDFTLTGMSSSPSLDISTLYVYHTNATITLQSLSKILPVNGTFSITVESDAIYTLTNLSPDLFQSLQKMKAQVEFSPPSQAFPLPYQEIFDNVPIEGPAPYFADQGGSFAVYYENTSLSENRVLVQVVTTPPGSNEWVPNPNPISLVIQLSLLLLLHRFAILLTEQILSFSSSRLGVSILTIK
jgi:galactosylceramidase